MFLVLDIVFAPGEMMDRALTYGLLLVVVLFLMNIAYVLACYFCRFFFAFCVFYTVNDFYRKRRYLKRYYKFAQGYLPFLIPSKLKKNV